MTAPRPVPGPAGPVGPAAGVSPTLADALARLAELPGQPVHEHVEVYDHVHRLLQAELAGLDGA